MENIYLYRHRRLDTNDVFYVGIGINKRAYVKSNRSVYWKRVINITDYKVRDEMSRVRKLNPSGLNKKAYKRIKSTLK